MHIAQLLPELDFGGVERGTVDLANELIDQSHQSSVLSAGGKLVAELRPSVTHFKLPIGQKSIHSLIQYKNLRKIYNENQFDIVHVRSRFPAWIHHISLR